MGHYIQTGADFNQVISSAASIAETVQAATSDPALGEVICLANQLSRISDGRPTRICSRTVITPENEGKGLGLKSALPALRAFVWLRENPALATAVVTTGLGLFWYWGYAAGRRRRSAP